MSESQANASSVTMSATETSPQAIMNTSSNNNNKKRSFVHQALDRIVVGGSAAATFVPSDKYAGSKEGYYFRADTLGTGYYADVDDPTTTTTTTMQQKKKPKRRGVQIAEDRNQTLLLEREPPAPSVLTGPELLQQAEAAAAASNAVLTIAIDTPKAVRLATTALHKAVEANQLARATSPDTPAAYMDSEVRLYECIACLKALAADPVQLYPAIIFLNHHHQEQKSRRSGTSLADALLQLLWHENTDICAAVVAVLVEWLDATLLLPDDDDVIVQPVVDLTSHLLRHQGADLLVGNLGRLEPQKSSSDGSSSGGSQQVNDNYDDNDDDDDVGKGAEDILTVLENIVEMDVVLQQQRDSVDDDDDDEKSTLLRLLPDDLSVASMLCRDTQLVSWLFTQVDRANGSSTTSSGLSNRALEILALLTPRNDVYAVLSDWSRLPVYRSTLLDDDDDDDVDDEDDDEKGLSATSTSDNDEKETTKATVDGVEILLQAIAKYRKKQPVDDDQIESLENACMVLASMLTFSSSNTQAFLDRQGVELVLRCLKERQHAGGAALKLLDFPVSGSNRVYRTACEHMVRAGALKYLFPLFMGRNLPKRAGSTASTKHEKRAWVQSIETTTIRILYSLVRNLQDDSPEDAQQRLLAKFVDDDRCDRLVEQCLAYEQKARLAEYKFYRSNDIEDDEEETTSSSGEQQTAIQLAALDARLAGGGDVLHRLAAIAAFCCVGSKRCHERILSQLSLQQAGIGLVRDALQDFVSVLEEGSDQRRQLEGYLEKI